MRVLFSSPNKPKLNLGKIFVAMIGMTVPVIVGVLACKPEIGISAAFGGLALSSESGSKNFHQYLKSLFFALVAGLLAFASGGFLASQGSLSLVLLPFIIFLVSFFGGISRTFARYTTLFVFFLIIATSTNSPQTNFGVSSLAFFFGSSWTLLVALFFWPIRKYEFEQEKDIVAKQYSLGKLLAHWKKSLNTIAGWQYSLRITSSATISVILIAIIPMSHMFWILLTTSILVQRNIDQVPVRMFQRGLGTFFGVTLLGLLSFLSPSLPMSIAMILFFSGLRVHFRENNYLLYSVIMTALVVVLLDFGNVLSPFVIIERLTATIIGCAVSFVFGYLIWLKLLPSSIKKGQEKKSNI